MGVFAEVRLNWKGRDYVIPPDRVMRAIAVVEDVVTIAELGEMATIPKARKLTRLAEAFGAVLRFAGAEASDEEVYAGLFDKNSKGAAIQAVMALLAMMMPPAAVVEAGDATSGKPKPADAAS